MDEILVIGDAHATDDERRERLLSIYEHSDAPVALQVGDLGHYSLPRMTYFIAGNNEEYDTIEALRAGESPSAVRNCRLLASSSIAIGNQRIAGLSGNFAPSRYDQDRESLRGDRRRHFTAADIARAKSLSDIDILLTHEAPHGVIETEPYPVGCVHIDRLLTELEPSLCLIGHHHDHIEGTFGRTRVVSLAPAWEGFYHLDTTSRTLSWFELPGS